MVTVRASIQLMHDHAGDAVAERGDGVGIVARRPGWLWRAAEGEKASLGNEKAVSRQTQGDMVIEAAPATALEPGQADLLLEFAIVLLDPVAALGMPDEVLERRVGRQRTQPEAPVLGSLGVLNDQPFLGIEMVPVPGRSDLNPARRKPPT